jgi:hypothetical protein
MYIFHLFAEPMLYTNFGMVGVLANIINYAKFGMFNSKGFILREVSIFALHIGKARHPYACIGVHGRHDCINKYVKCLNKTRSIRFTNLTLACGTLSEVSVWHKTAIWRCTAEQNVN